MTAPLRRRASLGRAAWGLYGAAGTTLTPLARPYVNRRAGRRKEDPTRLAERYGVAGVPPPSERPVWCHAVSVGESVAALTVAGRIAAPVVFTTGTLSAAERVERERPDHVVHQFAPLDAPPFVRRFVAHWRPRAALFTESEIWPSTVFVLDAARVPLALVNARLSDRSFARWRRVRWLSRPLFGAISRVGAQSPGHASRFATLGARDIAVTGNLKFDALPPSADPDRLAALREAIGARPVWLAASTHAGEEDAILAAHRTLARTLPDVVSIVVPRHIDRGGLIASKVEGARRLSCGEMPGSGLYVADTIGELGTFYALVDVVFLGGSLVPVGGHNPVEPAAHGAALVTGPHHGDMFAPFLDQGAAAIAEGPRIAETVAALLGDRARRERMTAAARAVMDAQQGALERTLHMLSPLVPVRVE